VTSSESLPIAPAQKQRDERRAQFLRVALRLFGERGYHETSISDIIEEAEVARGTFYNYFKSKRAIFEELLDELFEAVNASVSSIEPGSADQVRTQLGENVASVCLALSQNLPMARVLLERAVGLDPEADEQLRVFYRRIVERLEVALQAGQAMGIIRRGDVTVMALCTLGMIKEALFQQLLGTRTLAPEILVREILESMAHGILAAR
jgi:AcrR family transcriptional regulator